MIFRKGNRTVKIAIKKVLSVVVALPGILFVLMGLRWIVDPASAAAELGMTLQQGVGLSSQIGDMTAFFMTIGLLTLTGLVTKKRAFFDACALLLGLAAVSRVIAWLFHDAALAMNLIIPEVLIAGILLLAASQLCEQNQ